MSIDQTPEPKRKGKSQKATPTTTRRDVPAKRASKSISKFSLRSLLAEIEQPMNVIVRTEASYLEWDRGFRGSVELARKVSPMIPAVQTLLIAQGQIRDALRQPLDDATATNMLLMLLGSLGRRPGDGGENKLKAMLGAVADLGDPMAESFGLSTCNNKTNDDDDADATPDVMEYPVSPTVLAIAVKKLQHRQIFELQIAELKQACVEAYRDVR
jgi:hypothetical protein